MPNYMGGFFCNECRKEWIQEDFTLIREVRYIESKRCIRRWRECPRGHRLTTRENAHDDLDAMYSKQMGVYCKLHDILKRILLEIAEIVGHKAIRNWHNRNDKG